MIRTQLHNPMIFFIKTQSEILFSFEIGEEPEKLKKTPKKKTSDYFDF